VSTLREFFESEAGESLRALRDAAADEADAASLVTPARALRGTALLAADDRVHDVASALTESLRDGSALSRDDFLARLARTIDDLEVLIAASEEEGRLDSRARDAADRWGGPRSAPARGAGPDAGDLHDFAAREAASLAGVMENAVAAFQADPLDRAWLGTVLKHQRALLGSVQLETMPVVGESLRALEDLTELIVHLNVPVKAEWLDIFRSARDVLRSAHDALEHGETPSPVPALSRLRTLREELLSRYANRDTAAALGASPEDDVILEGDDAAPAPPGADRSAADAHDASGPAPAEPGDTPQLEEPDAHEALARLLSRLEPPDA
jgi:hypothetical protein